jgi:hypothetical protein
MHDRIKIEGEMQTLPSVACRALPYKIPFAASFAKDTRQVTTAGQYAILAAAKRAFRIKRLDVWAVLTAELG